MKLALVLVCVYLVVSVAATGSVGAFVDSLKPGGLPANWTHVLLLGADELRSGASRTDTMMVASISLTGQVKLTSIMRDTLVEVEGHGWQKINAAYAFGGASGAVDVVNRYFGLNIRDYVVIDFAGFAQVIDAVGGVTLDVSRAEMQAMNKKKGHKLADYGKDIHLDGIQALRYARIRKIDSDFMRTSRQRKVMEAALAEMRAVRNPLTLIGTGKAVLGAIETNMNAAGLSALGIKVLLGAKEIEQFRVPVEGTYQSGNQDGVWSIRPDFEQNKRQLRAFIYG
ncbi:MAG: LCP family protein [Clostridia bacterium]